MNFATAASGVLTERRRRRRMKSPTCGSGFRLSGCLITDEGFVSLASALEDNPSHLRVLDLSFNHPGDLGQTVLSSGLADPQWNLATLR